jgi:hypothetical protein
MNKLSDLCHNIYYVLDQQRDLYHIYTEQLDFFIPSSGLNHLKYGLEAHYTQTEYLLDCSDEELKELGKIRPKRSSIEEIEYQLQRKSFTGEIIKANQLISRLPVFSQSRNRNGKQNIADKRWKNAIKDENPKVLRLLEWFEEEESFIRTKFPHVRWTKGTFAISPCHIYPAGKDRGEDSWTPDKILRDISLVNKCFDKISSSELAGKHATNAIEAQIAIDYLEDFDWDTLSVSRQALYVILFRRIVQKFYETYYITDIDLEL